MGNPYARLELTHNPFEPAASGAPLSGADWVPERWRRPLQEFLDTMQHTRGPKAFAILGEYGSGKSYLLRWLERQELPRRRIRPFYFDNPGVQFYYLADLLLRQIGREEFAKSLWEFLSPQIPRMQLSLFANNFQEWLRLVKKQRMSDEAIHTIAERLLEEEIATDEEVRHKLGRLIVETYDKPYFEYRDFVAGHRGSLVAEKEEAPYFAAILRSLRRTGNAEAVGFLVDEFEEIAYQKRLTKAQAHEYLATMKRLIALTETEEFWIIVTMTPQAADITSKLEPALWERFVSGGKYQFEIPALDDREVEELVSRRLKTARPEGNTRNDLFPFPSPLADYLRADIRSLPRKVVKTCSLAIARAVKASEEAIVPFTEVYLRSIQEELYPADSVSRGGETT